MKISKKEIATAFAVTIFSSLLLASCKGRTMENMEPTGETVEVAVPEAPQAEADTDSVISPA